MEGPGPRRRRPGPGGPFYGGRRRIGHAPAARGPRPPGDAPGRGEPDRRPRRRPRPGPSPPRAADRPAAVPDRADAAGGPAHAGRGPAAPRARSVGRPGPGGDPPEGVGQRPGPAPSGGGPIRPAGFAPVEGAAQAGSSRRARTGPPVAAPGSMIARPTAAGHGGPVQGCSSGQWAGRRRHPLLIHGSRIEHLHAGRLASGSPVEIA